MRAFAFALLLVLVGCGGPPDVESLGWLSMGTAAQLSFKTAEGACAANERLAFGEVKKTFEEVERKLSIWRSDSEISRYVSLDQVSPETRPCYEAAFALQRSSGGAFNPFWRGPEKGPDLGGNLKVVRGTWRTGIRDPSRPDGIVRTLTLTNGMACATSGEYARGKHIRDGRTGIPVTNDVASVTVVHPSSAMLAEVFPTRVFAARGAGHAVGEREGAHDAACA